MKTVRKKLIRKLAGFDVLTDALATLGLRSRLFCRSELGSPWLMEFPASELAHFHVVERGGAWLEMDKQKSPLALAPGDLVVIGRSYGYRLVDQPGRTNAARVKLPLDNSQARRTLLTQEGSGATSVLVCGSFSFEHGNGHPLLSLLPDVMHLRAGSAASNVWLETMLRFLATEASDMRPGAELVISRLTDILFVQVLRAWLAELPGEPSWLRALNDPRIGPALALIHEKPGYRWSVTKLAEQVGLSRSPFTVRFTRVVGEPPQAYLTRVRMQRAARMIRAHEGSIGQIALAVGYESESSFNKAFKRQYQKTPGQFRSADRGTEPDA